MKNKYLIINAGSSSLKFSLYEMPDCKEIVNGVFEKIGYDDSSYTLNFCANNYKIEKNILIKEHSEAVKIMINELLENGCINNIDEINGVGHRVLHGGEYYDDSVLIDWEVLENIKSLTKLGPLHHPGQIAGIEGMMKYLNDVPQVAVFDTAFHQTMKPEKYMYAVPYSWYEDNKVRKYGFHGTSHKYITEVSKKILNKDNVNLIICHLGNGASISCIKDGICCDTTMGLTPLDGLMMGTRTGSIDPSIIEFMAKEENLTIEQIFNILNKQSGLRGICGKNDFRDILALINKGDEKASLAIKMFEESIVKYIAQYYFELEGNVDAIIFTAGIGENVPIIREEIINKISRPMQISLDKKANDNISRQKLYRSDIITTYDSKTKVMVIPTNEEYMILKDTYEITEKMKNKVKVK